MVDLLAKIREEQEQLRQRPHDPQGETKAGGTIGHFTNPYAKQETEEEKRERQERIEQKQREMKEHWERQQRAYEERSAYARRYDPSLVACPSCTAVEGIPCITPSGKKKPWEEVHKGRLYHAFTIGWTNWKPGDVPIDRPGPDALRHH